MTELFYENYEGEMLFDIEDVEISENEYSFVIKAEYNGAVVGARVNVPVLIRRSLFKTIKMVKYNTKLSFTSIGQESDDFICMLEDLLKPVYRSTRKFSETPDEIDFTVLNRSMYDLDKDKIFLRLFNGDDQSDFEEDEKINLEMQFSFNLSSKRATLSEVREGYSADLIAILMA